MNFVAFPGIVLVVLIGGRRARFDARYPPVLIDLSDLVIVLTMRADGVLSRNREML